MSKNLSLQLFQKFYLQHRYIRFEELIDFYALFGGLEDENIELYNPLDEIITTLALNESAKKQLPFFLFDEPFREFLIGLARGDGKIDSLLNRLKIGQHRGSELIGELLMNGVITRKESREKPIRLYSKQAIKKEFRSYKIEDKFYFTKPFIKFWFAFIEPFYTKERELDSKSLLKYFHKERYRLSSSVFEDLSNELLRIYFQKIDPIVEYGSLWNYYSEFDIFAKTKLGKVVIGECKYRNRPMIKSELVKLESKIEQSTLEADIYVLFSKSGFSREFYKSKVSNLLLFTLNDFKRLLE